MSKFTFDEFILDIQKSQLLKNGEALSIEPQVYCVLELLISRHGNLVSREEIISQVWEDRLVSASVIDNRIRAARKAIGDSGKHQVYIKTYPNRGYKFVGAVSSAEDCSPNGAPDELIGDVKPASIHLRWFSAVVACMAVILVGITLQAAFLRANFSNDTRPGAITPVEKSIAVSPPRLAILPFETVGSPPSEELLPEILESHMNHTIMAVNDLTLMSFASGTNLSDALNNYAELGEKFDLDYVIASKFSAVGSYSKLHVSLIRTNDGAIMCGDTFDIQLSDPNALYDLPAQIAIKTTIMVANKLNLSVDEFAPSLQEYDFYSKLERANELQSTGDYDDIVASIKVLRDVVQEEPNYLPAMKKLFWALSYEFPFTAENYETSIKEMAELAIRMERLSPEAPESLLAKAYMLGVGESGVSKSSMGEIGESDHFSIIRSVLAADPDNADAHEMLAIWLEYEAEPEDVVNAYETALSYRPTQPWVLGAYSAAKFCNQQPDAARDIIHQAMKWHPGHRDVLSVKASIAVATGDYKAAMESTQQLLARGKITHEESKVVRALFFDLGRPDLALPYLKFAPARAQALAMMGQNDQAIAEALKIETFYTSIAARLIADESFMPQDYKIDRTYASVGTPGDETGANLCRLVHLSRDAYVLKKIGSDRYADFIRLIEKYFDGKDLKSLPTGQEYATLMGYHLLNDNPDRALQVMDLAMDRSFVFVSSFREPYLRDLKKHPEFSFRFERMTEMAEAIVSDFGHSEY